MVLRNGHLENGYQLWQKGGGAKKRFQYCVNPNSSNQFLYLRAIQGHSGDNAIDPSLQDNALLPKGFTEYIYHVWNASEVNSIQRNGLIPEKEKASRKEDKVFTTVNPMEDGNGMEGNSKRLDETKDRAIQKYLETPSGAIWSSLKRKTCNFTKHVHMQSFSTTHYLRLLLRKRYV